MAGLRRLISNPLEFSLEHVRGEPFRFVVVSQPPPRGKYTETAPSGNQVLHYHEWGVEEVFSTAHSGYFIRYIFPMQGTNYGFFAHCLDSFFELFYDYMTGSDFGDEVTELIQHRWPKTFQLLVTGCTDAGWPALARLKTSTNQWAVTMPQSVSDGVLKLSARDDQRLLENALESAREMTGYEQLLPELFWILGGDDTVQRRLKLAGKFFSELSGGLEDLGSIADTFR